MEEIVKSVQLWKKVSDLGWTSNSTWSIRKLHLIELEHIKRVNPSPGLHGQLVIKP
jgi:hypothetical protein